MGVSKNDGAEQVSSLKKWNNDIVVSSPRSGESQKLENDSEDTSGSAQKVVNSKVSGWKRRARGKTIQGVSLNFTSSVKRGIESVLDMEGSRNGKEKRTRREDVGEGDSVNDMVAVAVKQPRQSQ